MEKLGNVFILGDSYSTFEGYIPEGYGAWYQKEIKKDTDVCNVSETWWHTLLEEMSGSLILNDSWSGTTICNTSYWGDATGNSFITRFDRLYKNGFFSDKKIDTMLIFGATNDNWANAPIGEDNYGEPTKEELFSFLPALCLLLRQAEEILPEAKRVFIVNTELKDEISEGIKRVAEKYGTHVIELKDISKRSGHPDKTGMAQIAAQVKEALKKI